MALKVKENELAYVKYTDEPVFVTSVSNDVATVRRVVETKGTSFVYGTDEFPINELQSAEGRLKTELDFTKLSLEHREKYSAEYEMKKKNKAGEPKLSLVSIPQADGNSYQN